VPGAHQWFLWNLLDYATGRQLPTGTIEGTRDVVIKGETITLSIFTAGSLMYVYGDLIQIARDFTDARPVEGGRKDYPTQRNLHEPKTWEWRCILHGGSLVKILEQDSQWTTIEAIDILKPPPRVEDVFDKPWLIQWATEITTVEISPLNGRRRWQVSEFPQAKVALRHHGLPIVGTPFPLWGRGGINRIRTRYLVPVKNGAVHSPYVPEK
jgi:hypothetical protein